MDQKLIDYSTNPELKISELWQKQLDFWQQQKADPKIISRIKKNHISWHRHANKDFHYKGKAIKPKIKLYYFQWNIAVLNQQILGIVWPRIISPYTKKVLENLFNQAKNYKLVTISWLASGVDQYAHTLSIQHKIPTIAVLGWWIKRYREHKDRTILQKIIDNNGLILSEYKLNFEPTKYSFPQRNRIIAGLSNTLFIPQAGKKSGSLITADFALNMKVPIYGVPNDIFAVQHQWLHEYIAQKKVTISLDHNIFLQKYFSHTKTQKNKQNVSLSSQEQKIITLFNKHTTLNHKQLIQYTKLPIQHLSNILSMLEIKWLIYQKAPWVFAKN